ncbi:hypothetical protein [Ancylobacter crimeensis]|nr:hypothetical protein [Ancylobacter crimeensis]
MFFLAYELWPYLLAALAIGLVTGWRSGCSPARQAAMGQEQRS